MTLGKTDVLAIALQKTAARQEEMELKIAALSDMIYKVAKGVDAVADYVEAQMDNDGTTPESPQDVTEAESADTESLITKLEKDLKLLTEDSSTDPVVDDALVVDESDPRLVGTASSLTDILNRISVE